MTNWQECKLISELPEVDEALRLFAEGETTEDQAVAIVQAILQAAQQPAGDVEDTKRLDALRDNSWDLVCFDMPTGAGDADIGWRVIEHHMAKPTERVVGEVFEDDPRAAIDAAIAASGRQL